MINKIQGMNNTTYRHLFEDAKIFTIEKQFSLDSYPMNDCEANVSDLIEELSGLFFEYTKNYLNHNFNPIIKFGGDCANVHLQILCFINEYYRSISANITIGEVLLSEQLGFKFNQDRCIEWLEHGSPPIFDSHAWITINNDYILDCTIGTYINTRIDPDSATNKSEELYGGLIFGHADNLQHIAFSNLKGKTPQEYLKIKYTPVIIGKSALYMLAPGHT
ncbi:TPA: hypothetical protein I9Y23_004728 [Kluyvera ascorbata]|uniref:Uncharacterized protein n=1 Tax=Kluyvera genomosp. 2 TaxID=2774054 RepID=A0A2T2XVF9_9ENTR|nr:MULTISPECIES: hypothetical protein [Enterobacteriaceae]HAT3921010.1 hypothetical protein [Kluyvera ascorbata]PSR44227.1 hypothetical protein C8256_24335 [Kluyvera genomosp. 2]BBQ86653.1 hypothetical protein WP3W18E02_P20670 [Klebsiella sp. WP3-W18-ESBL-02]BBR23737.1 hypothetical protein WP3S18E05_P20720 [Klebsiella sp. WP3-S18-ESBL-05]HAT3945940.1 hypothetical protein [Kluyvera ascorbata]